MERNRAAQFDAFCEFSNVKVEPARVIAVDCGAVTVASACLQWKRMPHNNPAYSTLRRVDHSIDSPRIREIAAPRDFLLIDTPMLVEIFPLKVGRFPYLKYG